MFTQSEKQQYLRRLFRKGANLNTADETGHTPLHLASYWGELWAVEELLDRGAYVDPRNPFSATPLHMACRHGHLPIVKSLVKHGANIHLCDCMRQTPLCKSCSSGHEDIVDFLLQIGVTSDARIDALIPAIEGGTPRMLEKLIPPDPKIPIPYQAVFAACRENASEMLKVLIRNGADVNCRAEGKTALHVSAEAEDSDKVMDVLLDAGASQTQDSEGNTPFILASRAHNFSVLNTYAQRNDVSLLDEVEYLLFHSPEDKLVVRDWARITGLRSVVDLIKKHPHI